MTDLDRYLAQHFLNASQFADACQLNVTKLSELVEDGLIPAPTYIVSGAATIKTYVFGEMPAPGATEGQYFRRAHHVWVDRAREVIADVGYAAAHETLREKFAANFTSALAELNATVWRMPDSFSDDGMITQDGIGARIDSAWEHFQKGTFGLCTADPVSEMNIAIKGVLQEKLTTLSENGAKERFSLDEAQAISDLIERYAAVSMPFSPIEYSRTSRKRLVDDLLPRVKACMAA